MAKAFGEQLGRTLRTAAGKSESRTKLMGAVHAAAKRVGLDADDRHALQLEITGKPSLAAMTPAEIGRVLDRLNKDRAPATGQRAHVGKVKALWWSLYWLGAVEDPNEMALTAFVRRQTGVERLTFLGHKQAPAVIEALKDWLAREGVRWPTSASVTEAAAWPHPVAPALLDRWAVLNALERSLTTRGLLRASWSQYLATAVQGPVSHHHWTDRQLDEGIRTLGKKLRRALERERAAD